MRDSLNKIDSNDDKIMMLKYLAHPDPNNSNLDKTLILTDESKGCDSPYNQHNLQSSDDSMKLISYLGIYESFGLERSIDLNNKVILEQLVDTIRGKGKQQVMIGNLMVAPANVTQPSPILEASSVPDEVEELMLIIRKSDYNIIDQLSHTPSKMSILSLLIYSEPQKCFSEVVKECACAT